MYLWNSANLDNSALYRQSSQVVVHFTEKPVTHITQPFRH